MLFVSKQAKNPRLNSFHHAGQAEYRSTVYSTADYVLRNYNWTPPLQRIQPSLEFLERFEDMQQDPRYDPFSFRGERTQLLELVQMIIREAFTESELGQLALERNARFDPTPFSALYGTVDFFFEEPLSKRSLAIFVGEKRRSFDHDMGFFKIGTEAAICFLQHYHLSYETRELFVITTNAHQWQLWHINAEHQLKKTRIMTSENFRLFGDVKLIEGIIGMIRYPLIRFENEKLLDRILEMNDRAQ